jgi:hypothetical protein
MTVEWMKSILVGECFWLALGITSATITIDRPPVDPPVIETPTHECRDCWMVYDDPATV